MTLFIVAPLIAASVAYVAAGLAGVCGPVQIPNGRSSHVNPTPVGGGLGVACGVGVALAAAAVLFEPVAADGEIARLASVVAIAGLVAALGALDDWLELAASAKLCLLILLSVAMALAAGPIETLPWGGGDGLALPPLWALAGSSLWVFTVINAVNFMDGANGLVGGAMAIAAAALAACALVAGADAAALGALALAGGLAGFLPWNARRRARVFLGDVGAVFAGGLFAGLALVYGQAAPSGGVYLAPLLIAPLLADVLLTLAWRARRGAPLHEGHRDHAYQRRLRAGWSHQNVAAHLWAQMIAVGLLAAATTRLSGADASGPILALAVAVAGASALVLWSPYPADARPAGYGGPTLRPASAPMRVATGAATSLGSPTATLAAKTTALSERGSRRSPRD